LGTLRFEILNSSFIFSSLERNNIYEKIPPEFAKSIPNDPNISKDERGNYAKIVADVPAAQIKNVFERNLSSILNFFDGKSKDFQFYRFY